MMHLITAANADRRADLLDAAWRFRHRHFVERFGWEDIRRPDGRDRDAFDTDRTVHLVLECEGAVAGYARWLPTTGPHLLSHLYPEMMDGAPLPQGEDFFEWTRCVGEPGVLGLDGAPATALTSAGVAEAFLRLGLRGLIVQTHPKLVTRLLEIGWEISPLNVPRGYRGEPVAVIMAVATPVTLLTMRAMFGIRRPVLSVDPEVRHPVDPDSPILALGEVERPVAWVRSVSPRRVA